MLNTDNFFSLCHVEAYKDKWVITQCFLTSNELFLNKVGEIVEAPQGDVSRLEGIFFDSREAANYFLKITIHFKTHT